MRHACDVCNGTRFVEGDESAQVVVNIDKKAIAENNIRLLEETIASAKASLEHDKETNRLGRSNYQDIITHCINQLAIEQAIVDRCQREMPPPSKPSKSQKQAKARASA
jgi:hypothetical protein